MTLPPLLRAFYFAKPLIPRRAQVAARQVRARRIWRSLDGDPISPALRSITPHRWPDGLRACALVTHDVETAAGQDNIPALLEVEQQLGFRSCWNFVIRRYRVDIGVIRNLPKMGHEVGVHGVYHDGRLFSSPEVFRDRLKVMQAAAREWGAAGFRSPSLLYEEKLLADLPFAWDSSMPAWDPFQPKPGGCLMYEPFFLRSGCLELPVTLWQDFTLFEELKLQDIDVWRAQVDAIRSRGGLINVIVHPDYMVTNARLELYRELLTYLSDDEGTWCTTPSEVVEWERNQAGSQTRADLTDEANKRAWRG